jgi:TatD DNase family protein
MEKELENTLSQQSTLHNNLLIDSHCHLDMSAYAPDLDKVLERAFTTSIKRIISIGIDLQSSKNCIALARHHKQIFATIGIHPHEVELLNDKEYAALFKLFEDHSPHIVGFGEIGLDYRKLHSDPTKQRFHFRRQLEMARELNLPVIIHNRDADDDMYSILRQALPLAKGGIMHCFSGDYSFAQRVLDLGLMISVPGIVTFKNSKTMQEVAQKIPLSSMLLETDGPYLAPHPFRGKRNEPAYLIYTAEKIAELRQIDVEELTKQTTANAEKLFSFTD